MKIRFVVDDLLWTEVGLPRDALTADLERLADLLRGITEQGEQIFAADDLYEVERIAEWSLIDLLFEQGLNLPRDLRIELQRRFDKVTTLSSAELVELEVSVAGEPRIAATVAYAATETEAGRPVAVLTPGFSLRRGRIVVQSAHGRPFVHFVSDEESRLEFVRGVIVRLTNENEFIALTPSAFPRLYFVEDVFDGLRALSKPLRDLIKDLVHHLSVLSDHGKEIFGLRQNKLIEEGFQSHGIDISPESRETLADNKCKSARIRMISGVEVIFEWHTKIAPHIDRIHVHPALAVTRDQVAVGMIHRHLPLPGD